VELGSVFDELPPELHAATAPQETMAAPSSARARVLVGLVLLVAASIERVSWS
jgi:hypothetical protein